MLQNPGGFCIEKSSIFTAFPVSLCSNYIGIVMFCYGRYLTLFFPLREADNYSGSKGYLLDICALNIVAAAI